MKPMQISSSLSQVIGSGPYPRTEVTKKLWAYIKRNGLQKVALGYCRNGTRHRHGGPQQIVDQGVDGIFHLAPCPVGQAELDALPGLALAPDHLADAFQLLGHPLVRGDNFIKSIGNLALDAEVKVKGLAVFARIDHAGGAVAAGLTLRPTEVLIFGNAKGGTPLMQADQTIGIDLPLKALVWQDEAGATFVSYNDPAFLTHRHGLGEPAKPVVEAMSGALKTIATKATAP